MATYFAMAIVVLGYIGLSIKDEDQVKSLVFSFYADFTSAIMETY